MLELLKTANWNSIYAAMLLVWLSFMLWYKLFPSAAGFHEFANVINSRGGNIILLSVMVMFFFVQTMRLFYLVIDLSKEISGVVYIRQDNAFALMALQFATTTAFAGAFGALLKTLNGEGSQARKGDKGDANGGTPVGTEAQTSGSQAGQGSPADK